ncbi:MAG TPA: VWA domain-containing protein [Brevundimonas sp.]|uniref:vWA domain-containing protein n=1 Tax=Brevundimonas sp. TaxID=1871086 RepID=UPI002630EA12|nr:VWA domain-containing protein [Brevundimonas sp.]HRO32131.1 VWA domain-containing protein [Brevundimonas sp.]
MPPLKSALVMVTALGVGAPAGAISAPAPVPPRVIDGEATAAACREYGFDLTRPAPSLAMRAMAAPAVGMAGPPPPPPPPPPPLPTGTLNEVVVSGSRIGGATLPRPPGPAVAADTERYPDATPNPVKRVADQPVSTFSIDVDTASYSNVRRFLDSGRAAPRDAVRVEEMINYFDYGYARPESASEPFAVTAVVTPSPWSQGRQIVHVGLQGYELPESQRRPLNLTFLVDVSGSMGSADKLDLAKQAMNLIIDRLRPQDTVAVTYYAEGAGTTLAPTPGTDKLRLRCAVASLYASGGTAGATGMTNAYDQAQVNFARDRVNRILMFTDGDFNVGVTDDKRLEDYVADKRGTGVYLSVYGFGRGNYQDARMQAIAQAGNGVAAYVDSLNEARRLFGPAFDRGAFPIADDVKVQVEFNPARVAEWRLIGYETRLLNEEDFANDRIDAGEVGSGASVTALYEITPVGGPTQVPDRRYESARPQAAPGARGNELGFVQIRYKLPGQPTSDLIQQPIRYPGAATRSGEATRWALAVAAFGQKLRGDPWMTADYGWDRILDQAQGARGDDPFGDRAEFVQLVRAASALPERRTP